MGLHRVGHDGQHGCRGGCGGGSRGGGRLNRQCEELLRLRAMSFLVVRVWAPRAPQCTQMNGVMAGLAKGHPQVSFMKLEAEAVPEVSEKYEISYVPTFLFFKNS